MDKEEIDELITDINTNNEFRYILEKYLKIEIPKNIDVDDFENERVLKLWKKLMNKIENGDYNYFWQRIKSNELGEALYLMMFSSKVEDIKYLIEHSEKLGLDILCIVQLIKATEDKEYIRECIENREKREELKLSSSDIVDLIEAMKDPKYIRECIENKENKEKIGLDISNIVNLIKETKDPQYIRECIEKSEELKLGHYDIVNLIKAMKDKEYIRECIEKGEKLKLDSYDILMLIREIGDPQYIRECIEKREELKLEHYCIVDLIKETRDPQYIRECIEKREKIGLNISNIVDLIIETRDPQYIRECIEKSEELKLDHYDILMLIRVIQDKEYIRECIEKREKIGLDISNIVDLIIETKDKEYIKECIEKREKIGLNMPNTMYLIKETGDPKYIGECLENKEKREKLGLNGNMTAELILLSGDIDYIIWCEKNLGLDQLNNEKLKMITKKSNIKLPSDMTVGVEIESEGETEDNSYLIEKLTEDTEWETKGDGSLINGTEVVSPVLTGNMEKASNEIKNVCAVLNGIPQTVSERCGGHIHIGADYLKTKKDMVNLIKIWSNAEKILYIIGNEKSEIPRKEVLKYAPPVSKKFEEAIENGTINLESEEELEKFVNEAVEVQGDRYSDVNFCNIGIKEKNTIEFRLANGTINPNTWIENVNLFGGIVKVAHELSVIQEKTEEQMTEYEKKLLENFKKLYTEKDEKQRAKALIDLCISPEDRHIYMDRYTTNSLLLDEAPDIKNELLKQISTNKIGEKVFTGENALTGEQYMEGKKIIEDSLIMQNNDKLKN